MYVYFESLPGHARIWIYQSNREFSVGELELVEEKLTDFVNNWTRHGEGLQASFTIKYNQFIILGIDENVNEVSGCSIDSSVNAIKQLENEFGLDLMNKLNIAFKVGENINTVSLAQFQEFIKSDKINDKTIVFNNMVQSKAALESDWEVPAKISWHKQLLKV